MSIQELGSLGEFVAAIATLATLIYLALQIRNNTNVAKAEAMREFTTSWHNLVSSMFNDHETSEVIRKGLTGDSDSMDDDAILMFGARLDQAVWKHNSLIDLHRQGLVSDQLRERLDNAMVLFLSSSGGASWWKTTGHLYPNKDAIDYLLSNADQPQDWTQWKEDFIKEMRS
jgi:hypothetical protein